MLCIGGLEVVYMRSLIDLHGLSSTDVGGDYSSKLAPWLAHGCISPRLVYQQIKAYESSKLANDSTYWMVFELLWRDFFRFVSIKYGNSIFKLYGPQGKAHASKQVWKQDQHLFKAWTEGKTGYPLVDANMRELAATGFMSNRGRQVSERVSE